jgi:tetratricopeptide (TPR) repeat protein
MAIEVHCDCGSVYSVGPELSGKKIRCKKCTVVLKVPEIPLGTSQEPGLASAEWEPVAEDAPNAAVVCKTCGTPGQPGDEVCLACGAPLEGGAGPALVDRVPRPVLIGAMALIALSVVGAVGLKFVGSAHLNGLLTQGRDKLEHGEVAEAKRAFDEALKASPGNLQALDGLVQCGVTASDWKTVKTYAPTLISKLLKGEKRGRARLDLARAELETSDWRGAEGSANAAREDEADLEGVDEIVGLAQLGAKELPQAEESLKKADASGTKDPRVALGLAKISEDRAQVKEARTWADKAAASASNDVSGSLVWLECGRLREKDGDAAAALTAYQAAAGADPKSGVAKTKLASALLAANHAPDALTVAKEAKDLAPGDGLTARVLGEALLETDQNQEARAELERAEKLAPDDPIVTFDLGKALLKTGDKEGGAKKLEGAMRKLDKDVGWCTEGGRILLATDGPPEKALLFLETALRNEPKDLTAAQRKQFAEIRVLAARAAARVDRARNARLIEDRLRQAIDLDASRKDAYLDLAAQQSEIENHKSALDVLEKGLSYYPEDDDILYLAGVEAMKVAGKTYQAAVDHLQKLYDKNPKYKDVAQKLGAAKSGLQFEGN